MKKSIAVSILSTMLLGFLSWSALAIIEAKTDIARLEILEKSNKEILIEMRSDIKSLLRKVR